jgi:hypothetical protein
VYRSPSLFRGQEERITSRNTAPDSERYKVEPPSTTQVEGGIFVLQRSGVMRASGALHVAHAHLQLGVQWDVGAFANSLA